MVVLYRIPGKLSLLALDVELMNVPQRRISIRLDSATMENPMKSSQRRTSRLSWQTTKVFLQNASKNPIKFC